MCLYSESKEPLIADKDIICYKVVNKETKSTFLTSFISRKGFYNHILKAEGKPGIKENESVYSIEEGFIHACKTKERAKMLKNTLTEYYNDDCNIVKCIIKKGSKYYLGVYDDDICAPEMYIGKNPELSNIENLYIKFKNIFKK